MSTAGPAAYRDAGNKNPKNTKLPAVCVLYSSSLWAEADTANAWTPKSRDSGNEGVSNRTLRGGGQRREY